MEFSPFEVASYYAARVPDLKQRRAAEWRGPCPIHKGKNDNFAVDPETGRWFCHSACDRGGDILALEEALIGGDFPARKAEVFRLVGRIEAPRAKAVERRIVATYPYHDEGGKVLFEAVRYEPKGFAQRRPSGSGGWIWSLEGVRLVPYRLRQLLRSRWAFIVEGEKDADALARWNLVATCNPMGAGRWRPEYSEHLRGRRVTVIPDNDAPGRSHAAAVAESLLSAGVETRILELPAGKDVSDWAVAGGTREELLKLSREAPVLTTATLAEWRARWGLTGDEPQHRPPRVGAADAGSLATRCLSDIEVKPISWLWPGRIARGKVTIIAGNPGLGKSQIGVSVAAAVTTGGRFPDGQRCEPGDVFFLSAEDDAADTLRPRLEAAGADLRRVHIVDGVIAGYTGDGARRERTFSLEADLSALSLKLAAMGDVVAAIVIDPISAYLGDTDSHKNAEVRGLLAPLSDLASRHNTAIIGVSHLTKAVGAQALMRVSGSLAFVAAARAAYLVTADPQDKTRRLFLPMKNNLGPDATGLAYRIEAATVQSKAGPLETSRVMWQAEPVAVTADEAMQAGAPEGTSALAEAKAWLEDTLAGGPMAAAEIRELAEAEGISGMTLRRARMELGIAPQKAGMRGGWTWSLPSKMLKPAEDVQGENVSTLGNVEQLREPGL